MARVAELAIARHVRSYLPPRRSRVAQKAQAIISAIALCMLVPAYATTPDMIQLPTVNIVGSASYQNIYAEGSTPSYLAVIASPWYGPRYIDWQFWLDYKDFVAQAKINPATTPDVRCNVGATAQTRTTTSHAGLYDRFLAAQQLSAFIRGVDNAASLRGIVRSNSSYFYNGATQFTFVVTYADGGREGWIVASVLTGALVNEGNVPGSLSFVRRHG